MQKYDLFCDFPGNGLSRVCLKGKFGVVKNNTEVVSPKYDKIDILKNDYMVVKKDSYYGVISPDGTIIIPTVYLRIETAKEVGFLATNANSETYYISLDGKEKRLFTFSKVDAFVNGFAVAKGLNSLYGVINEKYEVVIPAKYDFISKAFYNPAFSFLFLCNKDNKTYVIDISGKVLLTCDYSDVHYIGNNCFGIVKDGKWGLLSWSVYNTGFEEIVAPKYDGIGNFGECFIDNVDTEHAIAYLNGKKAVIDRYGKELLKLDDYPHISYDNGYYLITNKLNKVAIFTDEFERLTPFKFASVEFDYFSKNFIISYDKVKYGVVNSKGKQIIPAKYNEIKPFPYGFSVGIEGEDGKFKCGICDENGKLVSKIIYDCIPSIVGKDTLVGKRYANVYLNSVRGAFFF